MLIRFFSCLTEECAKVREQNDNDVMNYIKWGLTDSFMVRQYYTMEEYFESKLSTLDFRHWKRNNEHWKEGYNWQEFKLPGQSLSGDGIVMTNRHSKNYSAFYTKAMQIMVSEETHRKLAKLKAVKGGSMAAIIRGCIDYYLERELANEIMQAQDLIEDLREELE